MKEDHVERLVERARERFPGVSPRIISDNGPQSNGKIERWLTTLKVDAIRRKNPGSFDEAQRVVTGFVDHYKHNRLHSAIDYVAPVDRLHGRHKAITADRSVDRPHRLPTMSSLRQPPESPIHAEPAHCLD